MEVFKMENSFAGMDHRTSFKQGMRDGIPIGLGYLAVSFSLGIAAKNSGLSVLQGMVTSFLCSASAGEYAGFTIIAAQASLWEMFIMMLIANALYMLMSCAMSQRFAPDMPFWHRLCIAFDVTDELFAISVAREGCIDPYYTYGAMLIASPCWTVGTGLGVLVGEILPLRLVSAFSVALYGMFLAVIIPPCRKSRVLAGLVALSFAASFACAKIPAFASVSGGTMTIILTLVLSGAAALLFPINKTGVAGQTAEEK